MAVGRELGSRIADLGVVGDRLPLLGWYVGGEIGPAGDTVESHNFSGMFCVLSE